MDKTFFSALELMIPSEKIDELTQNILTAFDEDFLGEMKDTALLLSTQYKRAKKDFLHEMIDYKEYSLHQSRINAALIDLVDELKQKWAEDQSKHAEAPAPAPITVNEPTGSLRSTLARDPGALRSMEWLDKTLLVTQNICQILTQTGGAMGTGILIEGDWVITNHFILPSKEVAVDSIARFFYDGRAEAVGNPLVSIKFSAQDFYTDKELNFTIARLQESAEAIELRKLSKLTMAVARPQIGDYVSLIHHPLGGPKKIDVQARIWEITPAKIVYDALTQPGSSGGAVFNDSNELLGIHTGRNPDNLKYFIPIQFLAPALKSRGLNTA